MNFLVYGVGSKKKSAAIYAPLSRIEITADIRPDRPIQTLKSANLKYQLSTIHTAFADRSRPCRDKHTALADRSRLCRDKNYQLSTIKLFLAEVLYRILRHPMPDETMYHFLDSTLDLLDTTTAVTDFHAAFLVDFAAQLGFAIDENEHPELLRTPVSRADRQLLLRQLCDYYATHIEDFRYPLSLDVLIEVFDP